MNLANSDDLVNIPMASSLDVRQAVNGSRKGSAVEGDAVSVIGGTS
jgi:hypothetical protein